MTSTAATPVVTGIHPAAEIFPLIEGHALAELVADIRANGLREPITLDVEGRILDGRNRWRACLVAEVEPTFRTWNGEGSPIAYVVSLNLHRRHLEPSQVALAAAKADELFRAEARDRQRSGTLAPIDAKGKSAEQAAEMFGVSARSVERAREVIEHGTPELVEAVQRGDISVSAASEATELPVEVQREVVERVATGEKPAEVIRELKPHVANNSGNNEWYTPPEFIAAARAAMGSIALDPASSEAANRIVCADAFYSADADGLKKPWRGNVWLNPPYAQPLIQQFAEAVSEKFDSKEIKRACVLVNNATETAWFHRLLQSSSAVCLVRGRIRFLDPEGQPSGAPLQGQAVLYLGENPFRFAKAFAALGPVLTKVEIP